MYIANAKSAIATVVVVVLIKNQTSPCVFEATFGFAKRKRARVSL